MKKVLSTFVALAFVFVFGTGVNAANYKDMTIRAATANPDGSLHVLAIDKFKEIVEKESGGKININKTIDNPYALPTDLLLLSIFNLTTIRNQKVEKIIDRYENAKKELQQVKKQMKEEANPKDDEIQYLDEELDTSELEEFLKELGDNTNA